MNKKITLKIILSLSILLISTFNSKVTINLSSASPGYISLKVDPPNAGQHVSHYGFYTISPNQEVMVNVTVEDVEGLWGYNIQLDYDSNVLDYVDHTVHPFLHKPFSTSITSFAGQITVTAESKDPATPTNGTGQLFTIIFKGLTVGESKLTLSNSKLWKKNGDSISILGGLCHGYIVCSWTNVAVVPHLLNGSVGSVVTAEVMVANVTDLCGVQFNISWNPEVLQLVKVDFHWPWSKMYKIVNATIPGEYALAISFMYPANPYTGKDFAFATLQFKILKIALVILDIHDSQLASISHGMDTPIPHAELDGVFSNVETMISLQPSEIIDVNMGLQSVVNFNVTVEKVVELSSFNITVTYNIAALECIAVEFTSKCNVDSAQYSVDAILGEISLSASLMISLTGNATVATLSFNITSYCDTYLNIDSIQTHLLDTRGNEIPFKTQKGRFINWHTVAVTEVKLSSDNVYPGDPVQINVTVANNGAANETAKVLVWHNTTIVVNNASHTSIVLLYNETVELQRITSPNSTATISVLLDTTNISSALYKISANITIAKDDFPQDNYASKTLTVTHVIHDIAIIKILKIPDTVYAGDTVNMALIVKNLGTEHEVFNVTVKLNGQELRKFENVSLMAEVGDILFLNVTLDENGEYLLNATASTVLGETAVKNNRYSVKLVVGGTQGLKLTPEMIAAVIITVLILITAAVFFIKKEKH